MNPPSPLESAARSVRWLVTWLAGVVAISAPGQDAPAPAAVETPAPGNNRFGLSARFGLNFKINFRNVAGWPGQTMIGAPAGGGTDRFYDDGYVGLDDTGNAGNVTAFWGYQRDDQVAAGAIAFHSAQPMTGGDRQVGDDPHPGLELSYARQLGRLSRGTWGIEGAFGYTSLDVRDTRSRAGSVPLTTDVYAQGLGAPPLASAPAPYSGARDSVAPLISDGPTRSLSSVPGTLTGSRRMEGDLYGFRLGPYATIPLFNRVSAQVGGGFAAAMVDSTLSFNETTWTAAGGPVNRNGSGAKQDWLLGGYAAAQVAVTLGRQWDAFVGAQYQSLGRFQQTVASKEAEIDLRHSVFATAGLGFSF